ncbi:hypothetical protein QZH41_018699, partial [Actinostola sp. cb2023]
DAAVFLHEGTDNDKFDHHPTRSTMMWYNISHSTWYNIVDLMTSTLLLSLALAEKTNAIVPKDDILSLPVPVHGVLEIAALTLLGLGMVVKIKWQGLKYFFTHKRSLCKFVVWCIVYVEAIVVLIRSKNHVRVSRALRPLFLIDSNYLRGTRRVLRQIILSLPPILDMLVLLMFFIFIFSILGFYLFSLNPKDEFFESFQRSFVSLFVLLTTANYPDVMMPSYAKSRWSVLYFVAYIGIALYFLMNLGPMNRIESPSSILAYSFVFHLATFDSYTSIYFQLLAVVYETFTSIEKNKFRKLFLHKRHAARHAYSLLCNKDPPHWISLRQFLGMMTYFKPKNEVLQNYFVYKALETDIKGGLSLEEFYDVFEKKELNWKKFVLCTDLCTWCSGSVVVRQVSDYDEWFKCLKEKPRPVSFIYSVLKGINWLVTSKGFECFIYVAIIANGCTFIYEIVMLSHIPAEQRESQVFQNRWYNVLFIAIYCTEALLKLVGLGAREYFNSGFNCFDFVVTVLGLTGLIGAATKSFSMSFIVCIRPLRLLLLFKLKQRYRDVLETMWVLTPRMFRVMLVIMCIYYAFGIIGMECFAGLNMKNCCKNTSVEESFEENGYYYLNNFDDLIHATVTLFELTVVNNWFIIMEGVVQLTSDWSRVYFMLFYVITMVVMTIVVAFILEAFLFRIHYRREHPTDEEIDMSIKKEVELTYEELLALGETYVVGLQPGETVRYRGKRLKTKMDLSTKMYHAEIETFVRVLILLSLKIQEWKRNEQIFNISDTLEHMEICDDSLIAVLSNQAVTDSLPRMRHLSPQERDSLPPSLSRFARSMRAISRRGKRNVNSTNAVV